MNPNPKRAQARGAAGKVVLGSRGLLELAALLAVAVLAAAPAAAQLSPSQGKLLVATPEIGDPSWAETVLLLLHHDSNGTLGVALNRPTWVEPETVAPGLAEIEGYEGTVFRGGPVAPTRLIFLVRDPPPGMLDAAPILRGVYAGADFELLQPLASAVDAEHALRLYAGHAEWAPGQLEREIADGLWLLVDGSAERVFSPEPNDLWDALKDGGEELLVRAINPPRPAGHPAASIDPR